jgi:hypothetical protein
VPAFEDMPQLQAKGLRRNNLYDFRLRLGAIV